MRLKDPDLIELTKWFEDALSRAAKLDRKEKMKIRKKIRDEIFLLLAWEQPTPDVILNRWEERLSDFFLAVPYGVRDELLKLLKNKMQAFKK
jgi:hypothetical protein